jgi:hypothetical protein
MFLDELLAQTVVEERSQEAWDDFCRHGSPAAVERGRPLLIHLRDQIAAERERGG